ncbi:MAG: hypothetical protein U0905_16015 [Pirellulales bacterium]
MNYSLGYFAIWITLVGSGFLGLFLYESIPSPAFTLACTEAPEFSLAPQLMVFVSKDCPCSVATLESLERLISQSHWEGTLRIVMIEGDAEPSNPLSPFEFPQRIEALVRSIPGATIQCDSGELANRYGILASGHVLYFNSRGDLEFSGGITPARGHAGASRGGSILESLLKGDNRPLDTAPVFGCPLHARKNAVGVSGVN